MKTELLNKDRILRFILAFSFTCLVFRLLEILVIRTDQSAIGEAFIHKLLGILLLYLSIKYLHLTWTAIGFNLKRLKFGLLSGIALGGIAFTIAYGSEILMSLPENPVLKFYPSSYNVVGNNAMNSGVLFVLICLIGNVINVVMEDGVFRGLFMKLGESKWGFVKAMLLSSALFGIWHGIMPLRNFIDAEQSGLGALMAALMLIVTSFIFGIELCLLCKITGSLWSGMVVHFINNASVNLLHVVTNSGIDQMQVVRISIAQTIIFIVVLALYLWQRAKHKQIEGQIEGQF